MKTKGRMIAQATVPKKPLPVCILLVSLLLGGTVLALGQEHGPAGEVRIDPDRPHVADSSVNVPPGYYLQENGFQLTYRGHDRALDLPETLIRFGILKRTELRFNVPNYFLSRTDAGRAQDTSAVPRELKPRLGSTTMSGFQDIQVGFKHRLGPLPGHIELAVNPYISIPTGAKSQTSHRVDYFVKFPFSRPLSNRWELEGMESFFFPTVDGRRNMDWQNSILLDRKWGEKTEAFVEYASDVFQRGPSSHILHLGVAYRPARSHQFDVRCGFGLSPAAPRVFFGLGYSFLLGKSKRTPLNSADKHPWYKGGYLARFW